MIFALGSNEEAARLSGINVDRWKILTYAICGGICGIAGLIVSSRLNSAQPALGLGYELDAIAAAVIGGTSLAGGRGTVIGTIIGAFIMSVPDQRPAGDGRPGGMEDCRDRRDHHRRRLHRHRPAQESLKGETRRHRPPRTRSIAPVPTQGVETMKKTILTSALALGLAIGAPLSRKRPTSRSSPRASATSSGRP
jgi:hypothetical protein